MRPLSVQVYVKDDDEEEEEEEEEYKEDNCVLRLPDGTVHTVAGLEAPSHARTPLPTITEQVNTNLIVSYTSTTKYTYIIICHILKQGASGDPARGSGSHLRLSAKRKSRNRTESENDGSLEGSKSRLGLKSPIKECKMPRNQSAPHFVLANRNMSAVFTPLAR